MKLKTHLEIDNNLNGKVIDLKQNYAKVELKTIDIFKADKEGLVHGGFIFGAADYAAMACINEPFVVLAKSEVKFLAPVKVGQIVIFEARLEESDGKKQTVNVVGFINGQKVFLGTFYTIILDRHVLSRNNKP